MTHKKPWKQPELIVLVRNKPEEAVLSACKGSVQGTDPAEAEAACLEVTNCGQCSARLDS